MTGSTHLLQMEGISRALRVGAYTKHLLRDVSLTINRGDFVVVWGPGRSGKSTLLRLACGLEHPDSGTVQIEGADLANLTPAERGATRLEAVGLVEPTGAETHELLVEDYIALPLARRLARRRALERARQTLDTLGVGHVASTRWRALDDRDRAHVSLAHGLARDPRLLLVDDLTANMDALEEAEFVSLLAEIARSRRAAVLMVTSTLSAAVDADEAFTISDGRLRPVDDSTQRVRRLHREDRHADR